MHAPKPLRNYQTIFANGLYVFVLLDKQSYKKYKKIVIFTHSLYIIQRTNLAIIFLYWLYVTIKQHLTNNIIS